MWPFKHKHKYQWWSNYFFGWGWMFMCYECGHVDESKGFFENFDDIPNRGLHS
jgi:hypothetical protein